MQAKKGGEYGMNGEFYKGGQFLPSSAFTVKGENARTKGEKTKTKKVELNKYNWVVVDSDFDDKYTTIYSLIGSVLAPLHNTEEYTKENGLTHKVTTETVSDQTLDYFGFTREGAERLARMWNMGKRVITKSGLEAIRQS